VRRRLDKDFEPHLRGDQRKTVVRDLKAAPARPSPSELYLATDERPAKARAIGLALEAAAQAPRVPVKAHGCFNEKSPRRRYRGTRCRTRAQTSTAGLVRRPRKKRGGTLESALYGYEVSAGAVAQGERRACSAGARAEPRRFRLHSSGRARAAGAHGVSARRAYWGQSSRTHPMAAGVRTRRSPDVGEKAASRSGQKTFDEKGNLKEVPDEFARAVPRRPCADTSTAAPS